MNGKTTLSLVLALLVVQTVDVAIHVGTGQVEPIRLLSNAVLGLWAVATSFAQLKAATGTAAIAAYLALNAVFLAMNGITNPEQGDALRLPLFAFVAISTGLAVVLRRRASAT